MDDPPLDNNPGPGSHAEHLNVGDRVIVWIPRLQDGAGGNIRGIIAEKDENSNLFMIRAEGADGGTRSFKNISAADITKVTPRARRPSPAKPRRKTKKKKAKRRTWREKYTARHSTAQHGTNRENNKIQPEGDRSEGKRRE